MTGKQTVTLEITSADAALLKEVASNGYKSLTLKRQVYFHEALERICTAIAKVRS